MSDTSGTQAAAETEQKPPTLADIVREKTDDGRRIVDFFLDVMEGRIDGAELCHKMDAAKQLEKYKSRAAAKFIARYRGVSCGHAIRGRRGPADPCFDAEGSPAAEPLDASSPFSQHILSVLSVVDDAQLAKLVREKTGDGSTVIQFLDDVMHARLSGFRCHHRIAAAKELALHIVRDEAPASDPAETPATVRAERVEAPRDDAPAWTRWPWDYRHAYSFALENPREALAKAENDPDHPIHGYFKDSRHVRASIESVGGVLGPDGLLTSQAPTLEPAPAKAGVPAKSLPRTRYGAGTHPADPDPAEGPEANSPVIPAESLPRTRYGAGTHPAHPKPAEGPEANSPVIPAEAGTHPAHPKPAEGPEANSPVIPAEAGTHPAHPKPAEGPEANSPVIPAGAGTHPAHPGPAEGPEANSPVIPAESLPRTRYGAGTHPIHPDPTEGPEANSPVIPAESLPRTRYGAGTHPAHPKPAEGPPSSQLKTKNQQPKTRTPRRLRRQEGDARARMRRSPARNHPYFEQGDLERKDQAEKPGPVGEPVPNLWERRMKKRLEEHWHAPDPLAGSGRIDSTSPSRSPP